MGVRVGRWPALASVAVVAVSFMGLQPGQASDLGRLSLDAPSKVVNWTGNNPDVTGQGYSPPLDATCTKELAKLHGSPAPCDYFILHVDLRAGDVPGGVKGPRQPSGGGINKLQNYPLEPGDGVLVNIKWPTDFDQWNLYVDNPAGSPIGGTAICATASQAPAAIACGSQLDSNAQSVLVPWPGADKGNPVAHWVADYPVKVVPFYTDFVPSVDKSYVGQAQRFLDPAQRMTGHSQLLPRIQTLAPSNFHVGDVPPIVSNPSGWRFTPPGTFSNSCYLDETVQYGSTKCLRFDNTMRNLGTGPLTLEFQYDASALATAIQNETNIPAGQCHMNQEILWSDSAVTDTATFRDAGPCIFHVAHMHFHYQNMGRYKLFALGADGNPHAVAVPDPGQATNAPIAHSNKIGFCTIDVEDYTFGQPASQQRPRTYSFPTCNVPNGYYSPGQVVQHPSAQYLGVPEFMGISPGWGDIYTWDLPTQYIDISHVPDGVYEVTSSSNWDGGIQTNDHLPPPPGAGAGNYGTSLPSSVETGVTCIQIKTNPGGSTTVKSLQEFPSQPNDAPLPTCQPALAGAHALDAGAVAAGILPNPAGGTAAALANGAFAALPNTSAAGSLRDLGSLAPGALALVGGCAVLAAGAAIRLRRRRRARVG